MTESSTLLKRSDDVRYRIVDNEAIVVQQQDARVMNLNELGTRILVALDGKTSAGELVAQLAGEYDVDPALLAADVLGFLAELQEHHVVEPVPAPVQGLVQGSADDATGSL